MDQVVQSALEQSWLGASDQTHLLLENASAGKQKYFVGMCQVWWSFDEMQTGSCWKSTMYLPTHLQVVVGPKIASCKVLVGRPAPTSTGPDPV